MPAPGRKPKPADQKRNQNKPLIDWELVPEIPYEGPKPDPGRLPAASREWWRIVSSMPHCILWAESDWQFAVDTAHVHAAWKKAGTAALASELRQRSAKLGVTWEERRDLRIKYIPPADVEEPEKPVSLDERRRELQG